MRHLSKKWLGMATVMGLFLASYCNAVHADDWPQWLGPQRDGVWREKGIIESFPKEGLKPLWKTKIGAGYAGPSVANGRVFVADRILGKGAENPNNPFNAGISVPGSERIVCLDEKTGKILWKYEYDCPYQVSYASGPRCNPTVDGDKVYNLGTMGDFVCLNVKDGSLVWKKNIAKEFGAKVPFWGYSSHPLVDGDLVITLAGGKGSAAIALNKNTGETVWTNINLTKAKEVGYAPPMIYEIGGKRQLIIWHPEGIHSLNPKNGKIYWFQQFPERGTIRANMTIPTPRLEGRNLYFTCFYSGSLMIKLDEKGDNPKVVWQAVGRSERPDNTKALQSVMVTPFFKHDHIYGVGSYGELRCLVAETGERLWSTTEPVTGGKEVRWGNAFLIEHGDRFFMFNEGGDLVIGHLAPKGYQQISKTNLIPPTNSMAAPRGRLVVWTFPAFANRCIFVRNDEEIICYSLAKE